MWGAIYAYILFCYKHVWLFVALVNKGNILFNRRDFEKAREFYREALQNDSSCVEALYNFGESYFQIIVTSFFT